MSLLSTTSPRGGDRVGDAIKHRLQINLVCFNSSMATFIRFFKGEINTFINIRHVFSRLAFV